MAPRPGSTIVSPRLGSSLVNAGHYPQRADIRRPGVTRSPSGAEIKSAGELVHAYVACRISPATGGEVRRTDDTIVQQAYTADLAGHYEIEPGDTFVAAGFVAAYQVYDILNVRHASTDGRTRLELEIVA